MLLLLTFLAFGDVLDGAAKAHGPALRPCALKIGKSVSLHPADLSVTPPDPEFARGALRINGIERRLAVRPKPFRVVRMHPFQEVLDHDLIGGHVEDFLKARIPRAHPPEWIILPPPELGRIERKLQAILALTQQILCGLSLGGGPSKLRHQRVDFGDGGSARRHRSAFSQSDCSASRLADRAGDSPAQPRGQGNKQHKRQQCHHAEGPPLRPNRSLEQSLGRPDGGFPAGQFRRRGYLQRRSSVDVDKLEYVAGSCVAPLRWRQLLAYDQTLLLGSRDDAVG